MMQSFWGCCALIFLGLASETWGQTTEDWHEENQLLKSPIHALEAANTAEEGHGYEEDDSHGDGEPSPVRDWFGKYCGGPPPGLGEVGFLDGLTAPWLHTHRNARGTPWAHPFTIEPPHIHRDLFLFTKHSRNGQFRENEWEYHLDWSVSRRLGFFLGVPYVGVDLDEDGDGVPDGQGTGFGDLEFAPRVVLIESERFFLSANIFMSFPTGNANRDLGAGEATITPLLTTWHDLTWHNLDNHWLTAYLNFGPQSGLRSGDTIMRYDAALIYSFRGPVWLRDGVHPDNAGNHAHGQGESPSEYPLGLTSLYLEYNGEAELQSGGQAFSTLLTGVGYIMTEHSEVRFGVKFPVSQPEQLNIEYIFGFTWMY